MTRKDRSAAITLVHVSEVKVAVVAIQGEIANLRHPLRRSPALRAAFVGSARHGLVVQGQAHCDTARLCDGDPDPFYDPLRSDSAPVLSTAPVTSGRLSTNDA